MIEPAPPTREASLARYAEQDESLRGQNPLTVLLGDSLAQSWPLDLLETQMPPPIAKLGATGDRIQHTLYRLQTCTADLAASQFFMLMAGTNNLTDGDSPEEIIETYKAIVALIRERSKAVVVSVLTIPRAARKYYRDADRKRLNTLIRGLGNPVIETDWMNGKDGFYKEDGLHLKRPAYVWLTKKVDALLHAAKAA